MVQPENARSRVWRPLRAVQQYFEGFVAQNEEVLAAFAVSAVKPALVFPVADRFGGLPEHRCELLGRGDLRTERVIHAKGFDFVG